MLLSSWNHFSNFWDLSLRLELASNENGKRLHVNFEGSELSQRPRRGATIELGAFECSSGPEKIILVMIGKVNSRPRRTTEVRKCRHGGKGPIVRDSARTWLGTRLVW